MSKSVLPLSLSPHNKYGCRPQYGHHTENVGRHVTSDNAVQCAISPLAPSGPDPHETEPEATPSAPDPDPVPCSSGSMHPWHSTVQPELASGVHPTTALPPAVSRRQWATTRGCSGVTPGPLAGLLHNTCHDSSRQGSGHCGDGADAEARSVLDLTDATVLQIRYFFFTIENIKSNPWSWRVGNSQSAAVG